MSGKKIALGFENIENDFISCIGRHTIAFGQLEHVIRICIKRLSGKTKSEILKEYGFDTIETLLDGTPKDKNGSRKRRGLLSLLKCSDISERSKKDIKENSQKIRKLKDKRNQFIHECYAVDTDGELWMPLARHLMKDDDSVKKIRENEYTQKEISKTARLAVNYAQQLEAKIPINTKKLT